MRTGLAFASFGIFWKMNPGLGIICGRSLFLPVWIQEGLRSLSVEQSEPAGSAGQVHTSVGKVSFASVRHYSWEVA